MIRLITLGLFFFSQLVSVAWALTAPPVSTETQVRDAVCCAEGLFRYAYSWQISHCKPPSWKVAPNYCVSDPLVCCKDPKAVPEMVYSRTRSTCKFIGGKEVSDIGCDRTDRPTIRVCCLTKDGIAATTTKDCVALGGSQVGPAFDDPPGSTCEFTFPPGMPKDVKTEL